MDTATCPMTWKFNADNKIGQFYGSTHLFPLLKESLSCTAGCPMYENQFHIWFPFFSCLSGGGKVSASCFSIMTKHGSFTFPLLNIS